MLNIFNLFLFLLVLWAMFIAASGHFSGLYVLFGVISSALVSALSYRLKLIEKDSELLYLSFSFYRHFIATFFKNFIGSVVLLIYIALGKKAPNPTLHKIKLKPNSGFNPALLVATFNMSTGLFCVDAKDNEILVHAIESSYFKRFDLGKTCMNLRNINDDDIV